MEQEHVPAVHHEQTDANIRAVFAFAAGLVATLVFVGFFVWLLFGYFSAHPLDSSPAKSPLASEAPQLPPEPRLQTNPREDLKELRAEEDALLNGYQWVDRNAGVVRIPVSEAMRLTIERGLPARSEQRKQP